MLMAAGVSYSSPILHTLFHVTRLSSQSFNIFQQELTLDETHGVSYAMLAETLKKACGYKRFLLNDKPAQKLAARNVYHVSGVRLLLEQISPGPSGRLWCMRTVICHVSILIHIVTNQQAHCQLMTPGLSAYMLWCSDCAK